MTTRLASAVGSGRKICSIGFDDGPTPSDSSRVAVAGVVCSQTRFEGLLWGELARDGLDATEVLSGLLGPSKFAQQVHLVLTDGLTMGGLNPIDLRHLSESAGVPAIAVMRRRPDLPAFHAALSQVSDSAIRREIVGRGGPIHELGGFVFQICGEDAEVGARALRSLTDRGKVPEPLRLAHLVGSAVATGQSGRRA